MGRFEIYEAADIQGDPRSVYAARGRRDALPLAPVLRRGRSARCSREHGRWYRALRSGRRGLPLLLGLSALSLIACAPDRSETSLALSTRGDLIEYIAGEPLFREDVEALREAHELDDAEALGLGKIYALLAAEARSRGLVDDEELLGARRRALVQLFLSEKHEASDAIDEAEVSARYFAYPEGERPSLESVRAQMRNERTFGLILEEIEALTAELIPSIDPSRLPAPSELFEDEPAP